MLDIIKNFASLEKKIADYVLLRIDNSMKSNCMRLLKSRIERLNNSWDMQVSNTRRVGQRKMSQQQYLANISYPLVKQQILTRRAIFTNNFRYDPLFSLRPSGNTPSENAINMQDLLQSNNDQIKFRSIVLQPSIQHVCQWGTSVVYTEYVENSEMAWRTIADPVLGSKRVYGPVKNTKNAVCHIVNPLNYFQNVNIVSSDGSDFRGHIDRCKMSQLISEYQSNPDLFIKENIEKVFKEIAKSNNLSNYYYDPQKRQGRYDFDKIAINDIYKGQFQIHLDGNEDDPTYYTVWIVGDKIIRFQDNPYDMNMNQYTVLTCEPRYEYWWGNTPAEYSIQNENSLNLLLGLSLENALEASRQYIFFNKNAIEPNLLAHAPSHARIPVDVNKDVALNNILFTYQPIDNSIQNVGQAYARILENDQRLASRPDISRPTSLGGPSNRTATAVNEMTNKGDQMDADILSNYSDCLVKVGEKQVIILQQFLGNYGPIAIKPSNIEMQRIVDKSGITGNYQFVMETALQRSYQGEMMRYQNIVTWLLNLQSSGLPIQPNYVPLVKQILKMGQFLKIDEVLPDNQAAMQAGYQPSQIMQGQEMAGAAQEMPMNSNKEMAIAA